jgi:hypothetical protein
MHPRDAGIGIPPYNANGDPQVAVAGRYLEKSDWKMIQLGEQMAHPRFKARAQLLLLNRVAFDEVVHRQFQTTDLHHQVMPQVHRCEFVAVVHGVSPTLLLPEQCSNRRASVK